MDDELHAYIVAPAAGLMTVDAAEDEAPTLEEDKGQCRRRHQVWRSRMMERVRTANLAGERRRIVASCRRARLARARPSC